MLSKRLHTAVDVLGMLFRLQPTSRNCGFDRGTPVDRYYIDHFLDEYRQDIHGQVLEVKDTLYTRRFGAAVTVADVLDVDPTNPEATVVADLAAADAIPADRYDCVILTQVLQFIYDVPAAIKQAHRILRSGGTLLASVPCLSRLEPGLSEGGDWWRFTPPACKRLVVTVFGENNVMAQGRGNVVVGLAFLAGLACEELPQHFFKRNDPYHPLIVTIRAVKR